MERGRRGFHAGNEVDLVAFLISIMFTFIIHYLGTTWVQEIVWQIYNEGAISSEKQIYRFPFLEDTACNMSEHMHIDFKALPSPRLIKSHLTYSTTPRSTNKDDQSKYIYVARNPKDTAVSLFHFTEQLSKETGSGYNGPWEFFAKLFIEGNGKFSYYLGKEMLSLSRKHMYPLYASDRF